MRKINEGQLPLPLLSIEGSQKSANGVHILVQHTHRCTKAFIWHISRRVNSGPAFGNKSTITTAFIKKIYFIIKSIRKVLLSH